MLVKKSGQFVFTATVGRFVESNRHRPAARLDIKLTLRVLGLYFGAPSLTRRLDIPLAELFLCLEEH